MEGSNFSEDLTLVLGSINLISNRLEFPLTFDKEFKEKSIDELLLKTRASNVLKRKGVFTVGKVLDNFDQLWYESVDSNTRIKFWEEFIDINSRR